MDEAVEERGDLVERHRAQLEPSRLEQEQAALRRVVTLVAGKATAEELFATVAQQVARCPGGNRATVCRYESAAPMTVMAS